MHTLTHKFHQLRGLPLQTVRCRAGPPLPARRQANPEYKNPASYPSGRYRAGRTRSGEHQAAPPPRQAAAPPLGTTHAHENGRQQVRPSLPPPSTQGFARNAGESSSRRSGYHPATSNFTFPAVSLKLSLIARQSRVTGMVTRDTRPPSQCFTKQVLYIIYRRADTAEIIEGATRHRSAILKRMEGASRGQGL
jgi:hypothetical protein